MPLALSVSCPGELGDHLPAIEQLKDRLFFQEQCCVESVGWVHGFVVRLQERSLASVKALLAAEGCTVDRITEQHYEWPESGRDTQQHWRHAAPWNQPQSEPDSVREEVVALSDAPEPVMLPIEVPIVADYETRIGAFFDELRGILSQKHLDPDDFDQLLEEARHIVAEEDPERGPHAGLIFGIETALLQRKAMQSPPMYTTVSA